MLVSFKGRAEDMEKNMTRGQNVMKNVLKMWSGGNVQRHFKAWKHICDNRLVSKDFTFNQFRRAKMRIWFHGWRFRILTKGRVGGNRLSMLMGGGRGGGRKSTRFGGGKKTSLGTQEQTAMVKKLERVGDSALSRRRLALLRACCTKHAPPSLSPAPLTLALLSWCDRRS